MHCQSTVVINNLVQWVEVVICWGHKIILLMFPWAITTVTENHSAVVVHCEDVTTDKGDSAALTKGSYRWNNVTKHTE
jgi:hypothetical protein